MELQPPPPPLWQTRLYNETGSCLLLHYIHNILWLYVMTMHVVPGPKLLLGQMGVKTTWACHKSVSPHKGEDVYSIGEGGREGEGGHSTEIWYPLEFNAGTFIFMPDVFLFLVLVHQHFYAHVLHGIHSAGHSCSP